MNTRSLLLLGLSAINLAGCQTPPRTHPNFTPVTPEALLPPAQSNGAIYQNGYDIRLFEDQTAKRVGDILTVRLVERTDARKDADMDIQRDTETSVTAPVIYGQAALDFFAAKLASNHDFKGEGSANQNNSLKGEIAVSVVEVLPNGYLKVRGEKRVTLNQGNEYIRLSGIVRPIDIEVSNVIPSTKVADATIMYTGDGAMADASRMGWLSRFFMSVLFPF